MWQLDWSKLAEVLTYNAKQPMIFSSGLFLFLFLGFSLIYMLLQKKDTARILFVTLFSYYFYYKSSGFYFFLLGVVTVTDFLLAGRMAHTETQWKRMFLLLASLGINLGLLCYFKYTNFFYQMLAPLWNGKFQPLDIFLPVGISFFTFQSLSYTIDVYRRELVPLNRLLDYTFYVSFFSTAGSGSYCTCPRFYSSNQATAVCFLGDVWYRCFLYHQRIIQESCNLRLYQCKFCGTYF